VHQRELGYNVCSLHHLPNDGNSHFGLQMCANSYSGSGWDVGTCIVWLIEIFKEPWLHTRFNGLNFLSYSLNPKMHPDNCQGPFLFYNRPTLVRTSVIRLYIKIRICIWIVAEYVNMYVYIFRFSAQFDIRPYTQSSEAPPYSFIMHNFIQTGASR
jgi:hypothetical protein